MEIPDQTCARDWQFFAMDQMVDRKGHCYRGLALLSPLGVGRPARTAPEFPKNSPRSHSIGFLGFCNSRGRDGRMT
jgi:hypothetical protein